MILNGGKSRRFGGQKGLADLGGKSLAAHVASRINHQVGQIALNTQSGEYHGFAYPLVKDVLPGGLGPLAGILTAMEWAQAGGHSRVLTCAVDTPFLPPDWSERLEYVPDDLIAVPLNGGRAHHVCSLWPTSLASELRSALINGQRRAGEWIGTQKFAHVPFETSDGYEPFFNINTEQDLARAKEMLAASH